MSNNEINSVSRQLLQRGGTSYKSAKPPNGVPWKPAQRPGSSEPLWLKKLLLNRRGTENAEKKQEIL
ncbi:hypothetical protein VB735_19125 [Halotia wernerae UHCC 0503]|nr:hypothetical protein [Halotia wernerae UHCC 0503]